MPVRAGAKAAAVRVAAFALVGVVGFSLAAVSLAGQETDTGGLERFEYAEAHMGTDFRIVMYAPDQATADLAARRAFQRTALLDSMFSDYREDSEIAELARRAGSGEFYPIDREVMWVLLAAKNFAEKTGGAFDPTVGPLTKLWRWSARRGELPDAERLAEARALVDYRGLELTERGALLAKAGMSLDLGGIAKGFTATEMLNTVVAAGVRSALVDAGGDISVLDAPPDADGWRVETPSGETLSLVRSSIATSGDEFRFVEIEGVRYSHIVDPRTGLGLVGRRPVTVVAPFGYLADALASAVAVLGPEAGAALMTEYDGLARTIEFKGAH